MSWHRAKSIRVIGFFMAALPGVASSGLSSIAHADAIEGALRDEAPRVMKYIHDHGYHTVGVLKFAVKKGNQPARFDAGTLNTKIPRGLEHALILLVEPGKPLDIIQEATQAAASHGAAATLRTPNGRKGLFSHAYPIVGGTQPKQPDVFFTGELLVEKDMKALTMVIQAFDRKKPEVISEVVRVRNLPVDRTTLAGIGQSFALTRGLRHKGARALDEEAADSASAGDSTGTNPTRDSDDPVTLQVFYGDEQIDLQSDPSNPGESKMKPIRKIREAKETDKVKFVIKNNSQSTVGVVLAVDGKSTLFAEDLTGKSLADCTKWILAPGESDTIAGFYMSEDGKKVNPFKVLSDDESARSTLSPDIKGVIAMTVFPEASTTGDSSNTSGLNVSSDGGDLSSSSKPDGAQPRSLSAVQARLRSSTHTRALNGRLVVDHAAPRSSGPRRHVAAKGSRGLLVADTEATSGSTLNRLDKHFDSQPVLSLTVRYYSGPTSEVH